MTRQDKYNRGRLFRLLDYLGDRLSGRERNAMERQFQRDPFEADAVEGLSMLGEEEIAEDLARIRGRIQNRIRRRRRIAVYSAAAAIASLLIVGTIFINIEPGADQRTRSDEMARKAAESPVRQPSGGQSAESPATPAGRAGQQETDESHQTATARPGEETAGATAEEETTGTRQEHGDEPAGQPSGAIEFDEETYDYDLSTTQQPEVTGVRDAAATGESAGEEPGPGSQPEATTRKKASQPQEPVIAKEEAGESARQEEETPPGEVVEKAYSQPRSATRESTLADLPAGKRIEGTVVSSEDEAPLPGATVTVKGTRQGTVTDMQGRFSLDVEKDSPVLVTNFVGMEPREVSPETNQDLTIALEPSSTELSEVVVTGYGIAEKTDQTGSEATVEPEAGESDYRYPTPVTGMPDYREYLAEKMAFPGEVRTDRAVVVLKFIVDRQGRPVEIEVVRSPGEPFSQEAIRLVEEGPDWIPASRDGEYSETPVRLRVVFNR